MQTVFVKQKWMQFKKKGWHLISTILFAWARRSAHSLTLSRSHARTHLFAFSNFWGHIKCSFEKKPFQSYIQRAHLNLTRCYLAILIVKDFQKSQKVFISLIAFWINVCIGIEQIDYLWITAEPCEGVRERERESICERFYVYAYKDTFCVHVPICCWCSVCVRCSWILRKWVY